MLKRILTWFGQLHFHRWDYSYPKMSDEYDRMIDNTPADRICSKCGLWQQEDIHCLGLNPPEFVINWYKYGK